MDKHINPKAHLDAQRKKKAEELARLKSFPEEPVRDVLVFLLDHADLPRWKREVLQIIRNEAAYFAPLDTMAGRDKMFEIRRTHNDITFVDTFLTERFCREQGFFTTTYDKKAREWVIDSREFKDVKQGLLQMLVSRGTPRVFVVDGNHGNRGELRLAHAHEGMDIQLDWAGVTLENLVAVWGRPVHLDTLLDGKPIRISHDGSELTRGARPEVALDEEEA